MPYLLRRQHLLRQILIILIFVQTKAGSLGQNAHLILAPLLLPSLLPFQLLGGYLVEIVSTIQRVVPIIVSRAVIKFDFGIGIWIGSFRWQSNSKGVVSLAAAVGIIFFGSFVVGLTDATATAIVIVAHAIVVVVVKVIHLKPSGNGNLLGGVTIPHRTVGLVIGTGILESASDVTSLSETMSCHVVGEVGLIHSAGRYDP
mmetsp:Transcript_20550/g.44405  ORF Transcript_20550/g.44405 Transcript_20550/m.44405 type:complete len:201 (-) Transcript_20550:114-716(-)